LSFTAAGYQGAGLPRSLAIEVKRSERAPLVSWSYEYLHKRHAPPRRHVRDSPSAASSTAARARTLLDDVCQELSTLAAACLLDQPAH
jgi:hypothetical protein